MTEEVPWLIKVELIMELSISVADSVSTAGVDVAMILAIGPCWMDLIIDFLAGDRVSDDEKEASKICRVAAQYWLSANCKLYQSSFGGLYLSCLHLEKVNELLAKLHDGVWAVMWGWGGGLLVHRAMTQGFWWP